MDWQYKVVGAPLKGTRQRGLKTPADRIAHAFQDVIAEHAAEGWEYVRTDMVPVEDGGGWFSRARETTCAVMVFRRNIRDHAQRYRSRQAAAAAPGLAAGPAVPEPAPRMPARAPEPAPTLFRQPAAAAQPTRYGMHESQADWTPQDAPDPREQAPREPTLRAPAPRMPEYRLPEPRSAQQHPSEQHPSELRGPASRPPEHRSPDHRPAEPWTEERRAPDPLRSAVHRAEDYRPEDEPAPAARRDDYRPEDDPRHRMAPDDYRPEDRSLSDLLPPDRDADETVARRTARDQETSGNRARGDFSDIRQALKRLDR